METPSLIEMAGFAASITSIVATVVLGMFAIWLSYHFYSKNKETEQRLMILVTKIETRTESLQNLVGGQYDMLLAHTVTPTPDPNMKMVLEHFAAHRDLSPVPIQGQVEPDKQDHDKNTLERRYLEACVGATLGYSGSCLLIQTFLHTLRIFGRHEVGDNLLSVYPAIFQRYKEYAAILSKLPTINIAPAARARIEQTLKAGPPTPEEILEMYERQDID